MEVLLRASGAWLEARQRERMLEGAEAKTIRILILGDSISRGTGAVAAWPDIIKERLAREGLSVNIINLAQYGTSSGLILSRLPGYLREHRPQIVISMMGGADPLNLWYRESKSGFLRALGELRVVRVFWLAVKALRGAGDQDAETTGVESGDLGIPAAEKIISLIKNGKGAERADPLIVRALEGRTPIEKARFLQHIAMNVQPPPGTDIPRMKTAFHYQRMALDFSMKVRFGLELGLLYAFFSHEPVACLDLLKKAEGLSVPLSDAAITYGARCAVSRGEDAALQRAVAGREFIDFFRGGAEVPTAHHYRMAGALIQKAGAVHVAMQYPNLPLRHLRDYFANDNDSRLLADKIIFLGNEKNFSPSKKNGNWDFYFSDHLTDNFGHLTAEGHRLLADTAWLGVRAALGRLEKSALQ
jgi:hypothetical protein